ncbi:Hydroxylamine oxidoreductase [Marinobacterium lacunae]|uniref:Hydroxylamine oxidoreductase n=1 Tax=Marinobacterium lacunae TaxID=1232683 RepID=A0A081G1Z5_9GAMM|nr:multiheme c-type cytochrome [Marinobacterium lacunae]KEA64800.1 Hydroxylamine oxidoreductase [Marinobacterium lacunae]MBR9882877.1 beta-ketoacyl-ACP synthase [Oceanospirillales bacterium]
MLHSRLRPLLYACLLLFGSLAGPSLLNAATENGSANLSTVRTLSFSQGLTALDQQCVACHQEEHPGIVADWKDSRHSHVGVGCNDCHGASKDQPGAQLHNEEGLQGVYITPLVSPATCGRCHAQERAQFNESGHFRAYHQIIPKDSLHALVRIHEGRNNEELGGAPSETGCMQCHGTEIKLNADGTPDPTTWPNSGMGNIYPDGSTGNCGACHTRHKFSLAEARKPTACASCHLGPDHPDIEVFNNSKHGQIFNAEGHEWNWTAPAGGWEPGDYRAPTCATCHMSGIGKLQSTHNVTERLYWNLWAKRSEVRNSTDVLSPLLGNGEQGREKMKEVCSACHGENHTNGFFAQGDKAVRLYNEEYYDPAKKMLDELSAKGLLLENPWADEFQITFYHLWHHEGRRARHGALMAGPDYAHWHGFFELQMDFYKLEAIYKRRIESGQIEGRE